MRPFSLSLIGVTLLVRRECDRDSLSFLRPTFDDDIKSQPQGGASKGGGGAINSQFHMGGVIVKDDDLSN